MSRVQMLRAMVEQRLTAAVEEIFGLFERTIAEYEEDVSRYQQENEGQRKLLDAVLNSDIRLHRADVPQLLVSKELVPPEQQQWSPSLDRENPESPHIKEELWVSQEGEQLQGLEETDITTFPFSPVPVKSEDDEEEPQSSQLHQSQSEENRETEPLPSTSTDQMIPEADGEDCGGSEPDSNLETKDSDDYSKATREPQSGLKSLKSKKVHRVDGQGSSISTKFRRPMELKSPNQIPSDVGCKVCGKYFANELSLKRHVKVHSTDCGLCGKHLEPTESLKLHLQAHKNVACSFCGKIFSFTRDLERHMAVHTGQKPFSCTVCGKGFARKDALKAHMRSHTGEKPFDCEICGKTFGRKGHLHKHIRTHTGEKPFDCKVCSKGFGRKGHLHKHMQIHTGDKP